ncbi:hypothetical protein C8R46DRAFT_1356535 [Mycena filopes]|nr:hypothetical protein C8R46DRAFT_1356535 [Mycena filopes]
MPRFLKSVSRLSWSPPRSPNSRIGSRERRPTLKRRPTLISTLNPLSIQRSDYLDLSRRTKVSIGLTESPNARPTFRYLWNKRKVPFPNRTAGFLYYHRDTHAAPLECALRFRLSESPHMTRALFLRGRDLLLPTGLPWEVTLPRLTRHSFRRLAEHLVREELVTPKQIEDCHCMLSWRSLRSSIMLFRLGQSFPVDFARSPRFTLVGEEEGLPLELWYLFNASINQRAVRPFTGSATARFESALVDGRRVVRVRILKIVTPVVCTVPNYTGQLAEPKAGELLTIAAFGRV